MIEWFKDPLAEFQKLPDRMRARVRLESPIATGCWVWLGAAHYMGRAGEGYGRVWWKGRNALAHRVSYEILVGEIPDGRVLDHLKGRCTHRNCIRPDHLEPVTVAVNTMRGEGNKLFRPEQIEEDVPF